MLYNLLIVDDEIMIVEGIAKMLNEIPGIELNIDSTHISTEAWTLLQHHRYDIVIMDIQMPEMNGIEIMQKLSEKKWVPKVIFLTAYPDYSYMREAIQLGAFDYVLKIDGMSALRECLMRAVRTCEAEDENTLLAMQNMAGKDVREREDELRAWFLYNRKPAFAEKSRFENARFIVISGMGMDGEANVRKRSIEVWLERQINSFVEGDAWCVPLVEDYSCWVTLTSVCHSDKAQRMEDIEGLLSWAADRIREKWGTVYNFSVWPDEVAAHQVADAFRKLCASVPTSVSEPTVRSAEGQTLQDGSPSINQYCVLVQNSILCGNIDLFRQSMEKLKQILFAHHSEKQAQALCYHTIVQSLIRNHDVHTELLPETLNVTRADFDHLSLLADDMLQKKSRHQRSLQDYIIESVKQYIQQHLQENLSLAVLADIMNVNASYLSRTFSHQVGQTLTEYILEARLDASIALLRTTQMQIREIAESVGFNNVSYFNMQFRKKMNTTPQKYRESLQ